MNHYLLIPLLALLSCGCKQPLSVTASNNSDYNVSLLFTHDGVNVFRFYDRGEPVYFTTLGETSWQEVTETTTTDGKGNETISEDRRPMNVRPKNNLKKNP